LSTATSQPGTLSHATPGNHCYTRSELILIVACIALATLTAFTISATISPPRVLYEENRIDPLVFRAVGELLAAERSPYSLTNQRQIIAANRLDGEPPPYAIPFSYPPNALPYFHLRSLGDPAVNAAVITSISVLLSLLGLSQLVGRYVNNPLTRLTMVVTASFWIPGILDMLLAQTGHLVAFLAFCILLCHDRKPVLAGIALGLLAFKPHYAIPLALVAMSRGNWLLLIAAAIVFTASSLSSGLLYGWHLWVEFWSSATALNPTVIHTEGWIGVAALLLPRSLEGLSDAAIPVYLSGMCLLALLLVVCRQRMDTLSALALALALTILVSPNTHPYDMTVFYIPLLMLTRYFGMKMWITLAFFLVFLLPNIFVSLSVVRFVFLLSSCLAIVWIILSAGRHGLPADNPTANQ